MPTHREVDSSNNRMVAESYSRVVAWSTKFDPRGGTHTSTPDFLYVSAEVWILVSVRDHLVVQKRFMVRSV